MQPEAAILCRLMQRPCVRHHHHHQLVASFVASRCAHQAVFFFPQTYRHQLPILWCALLSFWGNAFQGCILLEQGYKLWFLWGLPLPLLMPRSQWCTAFSTFRCEHHTILPQACFPCNTRRVLFSFVLQVWYLKKHSALSIISVFVHASLCGWL